jgi:hypothetical protein
MESAGEQFFENTPLHAHLKEAKALLEELGV